ncbi:MAG: Gfo/Idh/MocA family oxidoreductase [Oscillospiraceae bacterium]|nr:Gfo/Idh/MocA family oxidoreductase [Oscillospiraceae bacterium]
MGKETVCIGMVGAGRACELHMEAYRRVRGFSLRFKSITAGHEATAKTGQEKYGFEQTVGGIEDMLNDPEIDLIDLCSPPYTHEDYTMKALEAGKYVVCEKPLTAYFGRSGDAAPIGKTVSRQAMYDSVLESLERVSKVVEAHPGHFMFAEHYVYAPAVQKAAEIIRKKGSRILCMKGEESLKGSSSRLAGEWSKTGGGSFIRVGNHPLSAIMFLKSVEAQAAGKEIFIRSITADMDTVTDAMNDYEHRHIFAQPVDVEDFGTVILTFSDGTKGVVLATDVLLGGSKNYVEVYCNDAVLYCNLTMHNALRTYFLDEQNLDDVYISEMLPSKIGWNEPFLEDIVMRGYVNEMQDFIECAAYGREPLANFRLAYDTAKITYAAYMAAELGKRVDLA